MEINNPLISIVMPLYNHYKYVDDAINSILNQTYNNIELIIVDDGSTDGSSTIALQAVIRDKRVKYVCQDNRGTGEALNSGYQMAKGKYGTWVSSDNVYYPQMLLTFYDFLQNNNSQFVFSAFDIYQNDKYYHTFKLGGINLIFSSQGSGKSSSSFGLNMSFFLIIISLLICGSNGSKEGSCFSGSSFIAL